MRARLLWVFLACLAVVLLGACRQQPSASFSLMLTETGMTVDQGAAGVTQIAIECDPGFVGTATLTLESQPVGASGTFVPDALGCGEASTLTLVVAASVQPGTYTLRVRGESDGIVAQEQLTLVVAAVPTDAEDGFDLLVEPATLSLLRGQQATVTVTVERRTGFVSPVALSGVVDPSAQHIDLTFDPALAADASTMTVAIGINVPPGSYRITVQGLSDRLGGNASIDLLVTE